MQRSLQTRHVVRGPSLNSVLSFSGNPEGRFYTSSATSLLPRIVPWQQPSKATIPKTWAGETLELIRKSRNSIVEVERLLETMVRDQANARQDNERYMLMIERRQPMPEDYGLPADTPRPDHENVNQTRWSREGPPNRLNTSGHPVEKSSSFLKVDRTLQSDNSSTRPLRLLRSFKKEKEP